MDSIFTLDIFLISLPIYIACLIVGYMLAIRPRHAKNISSFSQELYESDESSEGEDLKLEFEEDLDLYLKLSKMFRENGEFDKAVRIHLKMLEKENLQNEFKAQVLFELGKDYLASGMFNLAEEVLLTCLELTDKNSKRAMKTNKELSKLYERQMNWEKAIIYRKKLTASDLAHKRGTALLLCNLAERELINKNIGIAKEYLKEALEYDDKCILAFRFLLEIAISDSKNEEVLNLLKTYSSKSTKLLNLLLFAFEYLATVKGKKQELTKLLSTLVKNENTPFEICIFYAKILFEKNPKDEKIEELVTNYTETYKDNLQAIYAMANFLKTSGIEDDSLNHKSVLLEKLERMLDKEYNYQCNSCGYHSKQEFWYCPQCQKWDTLERIYR